MPKLSDAITAAIRDVPASRLPVVFIGREPRLLGQIEHTESIERIRMLIDPMLFAARLSAAYISRAQLDSGRILVIAHG